MTFILITTSVRAGYCDCLLQIPKLLAVPGWEGNIIISPQETECDGVGPIQMAQDKVLRQASIGRIVDGECLCEVRICGFLKKNFCSVELGK